MECLSGNEFDVIVGEVDGIKRIITFVVVQHIIGKLGNRVTGEY